MTNGEERRTYSSTDSSGASSPTSGIFYKSFSAFKTS